MRRANLFAACCGSLALTIAAASVSAAQDEPAAPTVDPAPAQAFESLVKSLRARPDLTVKTTLTIEMAEGDAASKGREVVAEFIYRSDGAGVIKLRGMTSYVKDGTFCAVHESTDEHSYFTQPFEGQPYWIFLDAFRDMPFPHLGLLWGDEAMEDVFMELHPMTPEIVPTALRDETVNGAALRTIVLSDATAKLELTIDPATMLPITARHEITGGAFVEPGAKMVSTYKFENTFTDQPQNDAAFTLDIGDRQRVDMLATLIDVPPPPAGAGGMGEGDGMMRGQADLVGKLAPTFVLATADGAAVDLADLRGQVVVLDFWATWCGPCRASLPLLHEVAMWARQESLPVSIITVNTIEITDPATDSPDARLAAVTKFWKEQKFTLPVAMDYADQTGRDYAVQGIPTTVVIRSDGVVHAYHVGAMPVDQLKAEITAAIAALEGAVEEAPPVEPAAEDAGGDA